uniref:Uncharacterized protein n=1 Tax=viral metagenome TaxID=1070528 RepID=A0A6C0DIT5_9ZZZZ
MPLLSTFWNLHNGINIEGRKKKFAREQKEGDEIKKLLVNYAIELSKSDPALLLLGTDITRKNYVDKCFVWIADDYQVYQGGLVYKRHPQEGFMAASRYFLVDNYEYENPYPYGLVFEESKYIIVPCRKDLEAEAKKIPGNSPLTDKIRTVLDNMLKPKREKQLDEDNEFIKTMIGQRIAAGVSKSEVNSILRSLPSQNQNNIRRSNGYTSLKDPVNTKFSIQGGKRKSRKTRKHKNRKSKTRKH